MEGDQVGVAPGLGVAGPVVGEGDDLVVGLGPPDVALARLVDVVADVQHQVDVGLGHRPVGGEVAPRVVAAADDRESQRVGAGGGQGPGPAHGRAGRPGLEPVGVAGGGIEPVDGDRDAVVAVGPHLHVAGRHRLVARRGGDPPGQPAHAGGPGPQDHRVRGRVEAGDSVGERGVEVGHDEDGYPAGAALIPVRTPGPGPGTMVGDGGDHDRVPDRGLGRAAAPHRGAGARARPRRGAGRGGGERPVPFRRDDGPGARRDRGGAGLAGAVHPGARGRRPHRRARAGRVRVRGGRGRGAGVARLLRAVPGVPAGTGQRVPPRPRRPGLRP